MVAMYSESDLEADDSGPNRKVSASRTILSTIDLVGDIDVI